MKKVLFFSIASLFCAYSWAQQVDSMNAIQQATNIDSLHTPAKKPLAGNSTIISNSEKNNTDSTRNIEDLAKEKLVKKPKTPYIHQIRFGIDGARIVNNFLLNNRQGYEFQVDYALRNNLYLATETGFGRGKVDFDRLKYHSNSFYIRAGIEKSFLDRIGLEDFDMGFLGARYGVAMGQRSQAEYTISSPFGSEIHGSTPSQTFMIHWAEVLLGFKVEIWKGFFLGWTGRGKFLINPGVFKEVAPNYIAGFGKGDKKTNFGFNFFISYAIKWNKNNVIHTEALQQNKD